MRRVLAGMASLLLAGSLGAVAPVAAEAAPYCGITWGSLPEQRSGYSGSMVTDLRSGEHDCFDRLVIDLSGDVSGYSIRYVDRVTAPGTGAAIPLAGAADLEIVVRAATYDEDGDVTYGPLHPDRVLDVDGYRTFRQVALAGSFEGETTIGLGVRARLPMRAFVLDGPGGQSRIVVDVAHRW